MPKQPKVKGSVSQILEILILDSSSITGAGLTGLVFNSAGLTCYYHRNTAASPVAVSLVTMTVGTFTSSGFKEVDSTNMPGVYQVCIPDAAYVTGADSFSVVLKGATNMSPLPLEVPLTGVDFSNAVNMGLANLDAAISSRSTYAGGAVASVTAGVTVTTNNDKTGYGLSAAAIQAIWDALTSALTTVGSIGKLLVDNVNATISSRLASASYTTPPTVLAIADQVWDEILSGHAVVGSTGAALSAAGGSGDPWATALPGAYGAGTAGKIIGDNVNATISSRSSHTAADVWAVATRLLTAGTNIVLAKGVGVTGLNDLSAAQVNAEVVDVLTVDTYAEPTSAPAATSSLKDKIGWLFKLGRNLRKTTSTTDSVYDDAGAVATSTSTISDDGTTFTRGEYT